MQSYILSLICINLSSLDITRDLMSRTVMQNRSRVHIIDTLILHAAHQSSSGYQHASSP